MQGTPQPVQLSVVDVHVAPPVPIGPGTSSGMDDRTRVATPLGWRTVGDLVKGDHVLTFDGGLQKVRDVVRNTLWAGFENCPEDLWPLYVPEEMLGNTRELMVLPDQEVMVEVAPSHADATIAFALLPGEALDGFPGVERQAPFGALELVHPIFDQDRVVFAEHGALMRCPVRWDAPQTVTWPEQPQYVDRLDIETARRVLNRMFAQAAPQPGKLRLVASA